VEKELNQIVAATKRAKPTLKGADQIGLKVGRVLGKKGLAKYFEIAMTDESFSYARKEDIIQEAKALDGVYIIRTSVKFETLDTAATLRGYKGLAQVQQAFRSYKTIDLKGRPIYHYLATF
jgi:uncharacterized protein (DUF427 family)